MKNELDLNQDIVAITTAIREKYPELVKYISEMPVEMGEEVNEETATKNLTDYYESLEALLKNYTSTHISNPSKAAETSTY